MQQSDLPEMSAQPDAALESCLANGLQLSARAICAAITELQKRGRQFSEPELEHLCSIFNAKAEAECLDAEAILFLDWHKPPVTDHQLPAYYSHRAIWAFSTVFTVIFGSFLLASNVKGHKKGKWQIIAFGIVYTAAAIFLFGLVEGNTGLTLFVNGMGGYLMTALFWKKFVGAEPEYKAKPVWMPLAISLAIMALLVLAVILDAAG